MNAQTIANNSMAEREAIQVHTTSLEQIVGAIKAFDGKVVNKRMIDAIKAAGVYVGWGEDWKGEKEMSLQHGYSKQANAYAMFYRTVIVPLVIEDGRLNFAETEQAIADKVEQLQRAYKGYAFEQVEYEELTATVNAKMDEVLAMIDAETNPYVKDILRNRVRRGY